MPIFAYGYTAEYHRALHKRREAKRKKLIAKGVMDGSNKMLKLLAKVR